MAEHEKFSEDAIYLTVRTYDDGTSVIMNADTDSLYVKKTLSDYNAAAYEYLKTHEDIQIPEVYSVKEEDGKLTVIEEFIHGKTLEELLKSENKLSFLDRKRILFAVCEGLNFLHNADPKIVHGDLKPSDILIMDDGTVKLTGYDTASTDANADIAALGALIRQMLPESAEALKIADMAEKAVPEKAPEKEEKEPEAEEASVKEEKEPEAAAGEAPVKAALTVTDIKEALGKLSDPGDRRHVPGFGSRSIGVRIVSWAVLAAAAAAAIYGIFRYQKAGEEVTVQETEAVSQRDLAGLTDDTSEATKAITGSPSDKSEAAVASSVSLSESFEVSETSTGSSEESSAAADSISGSSEERSEALEASSGSSTETSETKEASSGSSMETSETKEASSGSSIETSEAKEASSASSKEISEVTETSSGSVKETSDTDEASTGSSEESSRVTETSSGSLSETSEVTEASSGSLSETSEIKEASSGSSKETSETTETSSGSSKETSEVTEASSGSVKETSDTDEDSTGPAKETSDTDEVSAGSSEESSRVTENSSGSLNETSEVKEVSSGSLSETSEIKEASSGSSKETSETMETSSGSSRETSEVTETSSGSVKETSDIDEVSAGSSAESSKVTETSSGSSRETSEVTEASSGSVKETSDIDEVSAVSSEESSQAADTSSVSSEESSEIKEVSSGSSKETSETQTGSQSEGETEEEKAAREAEEAFAEAMRSAAADISVEKDAGKVIEMLEKYMAEADEYSDERGSDGKETAERFRKELVAAGLNSAVRQEDIYRISGSLYNASVALKIYETLGNYTENAGTKSQAFLDSINGNAAKAMENGKLNKAEKIYEFLSGASYDGADNGLKNVAYQRAMKLLEAGNLLEAAEMFDDISGFKDAEEQAASCRSHYTSYINAAANAESGIAVSWIQIDEADGYFLTMDDTVTVDLGPESFSYTFIEANTNGQEYSFTVTPYFIDDEGNKDKGGESPVFTWTFLEKVYIQNLSSYNTEEVTVAWTPNAYAGYYEVAYGLSPELTSAVVLLYMADQPATQKIDGFISGTLYYFKVRSSVLGADNKIYSGAWSETLPIIVG